MDVGPGNAITRPFVADRATFVVDCPSESMRGHVEAAFADLAQGDVDDPTVITMAEESSGTFRITADGQPRLTAQSPNQALGSLATSITRLALDADPGRLHLHCAAVAHEGRGLLVTARSGTGKTTLAAKLLTRGWAYGSDEAVALEPETQTVAAFPKPLMIKEGSRFPVEAVAHHRIDVGTDDDKIWTVPASALGVDLVERVEPSCVVVLAGSGQQPQSFPSPIVTIHPTDAVVAMMQQTMDAGRFGPPSVDALAGLAASCHCVRMQVGPLDAAAEAIQDLVAAAPTRHPVRALTPAPLVDWPWHVSEHTRSVLIEDRVVIHETMTGAITALDEAGTALWLTLLGAPPDGWGPVVLQDAGIRGFVEQLVTLGFVHEGERHAEHA